MAKKANFNIFTLTKVMFLLFIVAVTILPFINMIAVSLSSESYVLKNQVAFFPKGFNLNTYVMVLKDKHILTAYMNTIVYVIVGTSLSLFVTTSGAYALSNKNMPFQKLITIMVIICMFFDGGMIPTYLVVKNLGLIDKMWAVILPSVMSTWYLIIMRTFFSALPKELEDSGKVDGLNDIGILWNIVLPLSKAVIATISLFYAVRMWNSFFDPFIYLQDDKKYPLQVVLRAMLVKDELRYASGGTSSEGAVIQESMKYATILVSTLPILMVYPFLQKYFVKGVMIGSLKG